MISAETESRLLQLQKNESDYLPLPEEAARIAGKRLVCFVGATGMGKSSIMNGLAESNPDYGEFHTIVTRGPRATDKQDHYTYYPHTDEGLAPLLEKMESRRILQYIVIPKSLSIRATEASSYPYLVNLGDIVPSAFITFDRLGFGHIQKISIVTEPDAWKNHLDERFPVGHPDRPARLNEAVTNLGWSLSQTPESGHGRVINGYGKLDRAIQSADVAIRHSRFVDQEEAQELGRACLDLTMELAA